MILGRFQDSYLAAWGPDETRFPFSKLTAAICGDNSVKPISHGSGYHSQQCPQFPGVRHTAQDVQRRITLLITPVSVDQDDRLKGASLKIVDFDQRTACRGLGGHE